MEYRAKYLIHSKKQRLFLVVYEFSSSTNEVVLYWENTDVQTGNSKSSTVKGISSCGMHLSLSARVSSCIMFK